MRYSRQRLVVLVGTLWCAVSPVGTQADPDGQPIVQANGDQTLATMAPDGQGGAFVVWLDWTSNNGIDLVMQRVLGSGNAVAGWPEDGAVVCDAPGDQIAPCAVADGWGGAYVVWEDLRGVDPDIRAQHFDPFGRVHAGWPAGGLLVCGATGVQSEPAVAGDGEHGVFVVWSDHRLPLDGNIMVQHIDPYGELEPRWPADGQLVCRASGVQRSPTLVTDGAGGVIVAWEDLRAGATSDLYVQHVRADLNPDVWGRDGLDVCLAPGDQEAPRLAPDGAGGAFIVWQDLRGTYYDVYGHHIANRGTGDWGWAVDGSPICNQPGGQLNPCVVADGSGGAIVAWMDSRAVTDFDIYALRVAAHAPVAPEWPSPGVALCWAAGDQIHPQIASDEQGGAFVCWTDERSGMGRDIYTQRITSLGILPACWPANGTPICAATDDQETPRIVADGRWRALLAWTDWRNRAIATRADVYGAMVTADVAPVAPTPADGAPVAAAAGDQVPNGSRRAAAMVPDGTGGTYIAWEDARGDGTDVFVQHVGLDGRPAPGWPTDGSVVADAGGGIRSAPSLAADRAGGVYVVWQEQHTTAFELDIRLQRFASSGGRAPGWPPEGVAVCTAPGLQSAPRLALDAYGYVFVAWEDFRGGPAADLYLSRITPQGTRALFWPENGEAICDRPGNQVQPALIGAGQGAIVFWSDGRFGERDLYGVGIAVDGGVAPNWAGGGTVVCRAAGHQVEPAVIDDGDHGVILCWLDERSGTRTPYALRLTALGNRVGLWPENGIALVDPSTAGEARDLRVAPDGSGGLLAAWCRRWGDVYDVRVQRLMTDRTRAPGWPADGVSVSLAAAQALFPALASNGTGRSVIAWSDLRAGAPDIYVQQLDERGAAGVWEDGGRALCTASGSQWAPEAIATPGCGAVVCWFDERGTDADVYAAHVDLAPRATDTVPREDEAALARLRASPNPFHRSTSIRIDTAPPGGLAVDIYDVAGRCVRRLRTAAGPAGPRGVTWDGCDGRGDAVPAGTYLVRVHGDGHAATAKVVRGH